MNSKRKISRGKKNPNPESPPPNLQSIGGCFSDLALCSNVSTTGHNAQGCQFNNPPEERSKLRRTSFVAALQWPVSVLQHMNLNRNHELNHEKHSQTKTGCRTFNQQHLQMQR